MENDNQKNASDLRNSSSIRVFIGIFLIIAGVVDILVSLDLIEYIDTRPNRIAIFNDPHTWEVFALGTTLLFFGIANILPARMKFLGRLNASLLLISFIAVVIGVILQKIK
jgi:hypothetical protein